MISRLYLGDAFGWDSESTAKVAIAQAIDEQIIDNTKCPKSQLLTNESIRWQPNIIKILGYLPLVNVVAGILVFKEIGEREAKAYYEPNHTKKWQARAVAMILTGPLLLPIDLITFIWDLYIANKYAKEHPEAIAAFDTPHRHKSPTHYFPGSAVFSCMT